MYIAVVIDTPEVIQHTRSEIEYYSNVCSHEDLLRMSENFTSFFGCYKKYLVLFVIFPKYFV
jgi:hypothetical protein